MNILPIVRELVFAIYTPELNERFEHSKRALELLNALEAEPAPSSPSVCRPEDEIAEAEIITDALRKQAQLWSERACDLEGTGKEDEVVVARARENLADRAVALLERYIKKVAALADYEPSEAAVEAAWSAYVNTVGGNFRAMIRAALKAAHAVSEKERT